MSDDKIIDEVLAEDAALRCAVSGAKNVNSAMSTIDALRQQLADVSNERDELRKQREAILMQARVWAGEAKTQRSTVESVGAILGGIPDWGPIAAGAEALKSRLNASEARNSAMAKLLETWQTWLGARGDSCDETGKVLWDRIDALLAQSAPASRLQSEPVHACQKCYGRGFMPTREDGEGETEYRARCKLYAEQSAPATDEQGAGS